MDTGPIIGISSLSDEELLRCFDFLSLWDLKISATVVSWSWRTIGERKLSALLATPGQEVVVHGIKKKESLNGQVGIIVHSKSNQPRKKSRLLVKLKDCCVSLNTENLRFVGLVVPPKLESSIKIAEYEIPRNTLETAKFYGFCRGSPGAINLTLGCHRCESPKESGYYALTENFNPIRLECKNCLALNASKDLSSPLLEETVEEYVRRRLMSPNDCLNIVKGHNLLGM